MLVALAVSPASARQAAPELPFVSVPDPLKLPDDIHFGEIAGVAVNSKGHIFVFSRGNSTGPSYMATASQLLEFDANGKFIREIGKNLYAWSYAHAVRIDKDDNIWVVDKGSDVILKMNPQGRVVWVFGRKGEASHFMVPPDYAATLSGLLARAGVAVTPPAANNPRNPVPVHRDNAFNQPTDVAWDSKGNSYFSDGYVNSRVGKANARGEWVASWGSLGTGPGQFDTPHGVAVSPKDEVYVADRGNRRIQVFDTEGKYLREFTIDVPVDTKRGKITFGQEAPNAKTGSQAPGAPDALCMTPGPNPVLFVGDLYPSRIYK
ncbi:MAG: 6-bladed beta-propeller, partial [Vicinamibacterales bacterium]